MIGALMFSPLLGLAGYLIKIRSRWATYGVALMASLFFSEALYRLNKTDVVTAGFSDGWYVFAILGVGSCSRLFLVLDTNRSLYAASSRLLHSHTLELP
ncbi:DUF6518 family protein [Cryobacterium sp. M23]|uniref:DUF6518 family protein n=1 Tax=Cryobacterium sp. M23 TaxID=2048292 RepID=UPI000CE449E2